MKLVVMIPAYNEEESIASVIREIPRDCCDVVQVLVIDDGSTDNTSVEAKSAGADKVLRLKKNRGLARAFRAGIEVALGMGADIIVNTDADGQYDGRDILKLIEPILCGKADFVLGSRIKGRIEEMPATKMLGNRMATAVTRYLSGLDISDAQTGFRAFTREVALRLNVNGSYTYTQEMIIQLARGQKGISVIDVPILFRKRKGGKSRLIHNIFSYAIRAGTTMIRTYRDYEPLKTFMYIGGFFLLLGAATGTVVLYHYFTTGIVTGRLPMALLSVLFLILGFQSILIGILADMLMSQKRVQDEVLYRLKKMEYDK